MSAADPTRRAIQAGVAALTAYPTFLILKAAVERPTGFLTNVVEGISHGGVYALIALGYTMVYGVLGLINFAHSDVFMIGAYVGSSDGPVLGASVGSTTTDLSRGRYGETLKMSKAQSPAAWLMVAAVSVAGCEHAMVGNATALVLTLGLFVGTLQLGRQRAPQSSAAEATTASTSAHG